MPVCLFMRLKFALLIVGIFIVATAPAAEQRVAPDWTLRTPEGEPVTLSEVAAKRPVLLLFWATWCPYCKALMPHLQSIGLENGGKIEILSIHFRDDKGDPAGFIRDAGYDFTVLTNGTDVAELNGIWSTPGVFIVDTDRVIRFDLYNLPKPEIEPSQKSRLSRALLGRRDS
jgi:cytochrome c biogenesis protein CcmG/thiol:disulfide interchange protein DsbE